MTKIAIIGYGKMGRTIEQIALQNSIKISHIIDSYKDLEDAVFQGDEIAIEFTQPEHCINNIKLLSEKKINTVCGTTGWYDKLEHLKKIIANSRIAFLYASNFSIGVNIFWNTIENISKTMNKIEDYDVMGHELHHKHKKDSPSGTAIHTGEILLKNIVRKKKLLTETLANREILPEELHFTSTRIGSTIGKHTVVFDSIYDTIEISHNSKSRECYAIGAIKAAKWLVNKSGFFNFQKYTGEIGNVQF